MRKAKLIADQHKDLTWLQKFIKELKDKKFYGTIDLVFQKGRIVTYHKKETGKPD